MRRTGPDRTGPTACKDAVAPQAERLFCLITGDEIVIVLFTTEYFKKNIKLKGKTENDPASQPLCNARPRAIFARALLESTVQCEGSHSRKPTQFICLVII